MKPRQPPRIGRTVKCQFQCANPVRKGAWCCDGHYENTPPHLRTVIDTAWKAQDMKTWADGMIKAKTYFRGPESDDRA